MIASQRASVASDGSFSNARGRYAPRERVEDLCQATESVVHGKPSAEVFVRLIVRELKIRFYQPKTIKSYRSSIVSLLRWFGAPPHRLTREDVREYLLYLVDAGLSSSTVANQLAAIRTAFDKMCLRKVTGGLAVPRKPKKLPVVLSGSEVIALLQATPSLRDKLLLGLMYATGMRVSEVVRVRWRDIDFARRVITVWQGKGRTDRQVQLPACFESLLRELSKGFAAEHFLFPGEQRNAVRRACRSAKNIRHLSPRTAQRIMERAVLIVGIKKRATPHSLRHSFATHSYENGCDIRRIQKLLGHMRLETTTIYVKVAQPCDQAMAPSPLDHLYQTPSKPSAEQRPPVGNLRIYFQQQFNDQYHRLAKVTLEVLPSGGSNQEGPEPPIYFTGIVAKEVRSGYVTLEIPALEQWAEPLRMLSRSQRERFEGPDFYQMLQREITRRLCLLPEKPF